MPERKSPRAGDVLPRQAEQGRRGAGGVEQGVGGEPRVEEEAAGEDDGAGGGGRVRVVVADEGDGEGHAEEGGALHGPVEVGEDKQGHAVGVVAAAGWGDPEAIAAAAREVGIACQPGVGGQGVGRVGR